MTGPRITRAELTAAQVSEILALVGAARLADGVAPLSEHGMLHLRYDSASQSRTAGTLSSPRTVRSRVTPTWIRRRPRARLTGELVIHPERRRQGLGRALTGELAAAAGGHVLRLWAHGDLPAAAALARAAGFDRFRALWQMRRSLREPLDQPVLPAGRTLRTFVPGRDEDEWLSLNGRAFAKHPEQGGWTRHDLELREREPWFDPAGFFIAEQTARWPASTGPRCTSCPELGDRPRHEPGGGLRGRGRSRRAGQRARPGAHPGRTAAPA